MSERKRELLTPDAVVDAAVELTRRVGFDDWSVRDLAGALGTSTSVIYHHVGGRDEICRRVAERCISSFVPPADDLPWQEWFRVAFRSAPAQMRQFRGLAKWTMMHGPLFIGVLPFLDAAVAKLEEAGFGERVPLVYATIFNTMTATMMAMDERKSAGDDGPRDHRTMFAAGSELAEQSPGLRAILGYMSEYTGSAEQSAEAAARYQEFLLDTLLSGLAQTLPTAQA